MSNIERAKGPYIVWLNYGYDGWYPDSYNTLKEALEADKYSSEYVITKKCEYEIVEKE